MFRAKLEWYQQGGRVSDQQWRDILGILASQSGRIDEEYLRTWARSLGLEELLRKAWQDAGR